MPDTPLALPAALPFNPALAEALARAAAAAARLDQALGHHTLQPAFLHRVRLDAVRRQAAVDGAAIDPWHLAALIEGLRPRLDGTVRIIDRGAVFEAARYALTLHQWLHEPDPDQEGDIQHATIFLQVPPGSVALLAAAEGVRAWINAGGTRPAMRGALVRFWTRTSLLRTAVPLTGAAAFRAGQDWTPLPWTVAFLHAVAGEAEAWLDLLLDMERAWLAARRRVAGRRRHSRAGLAIDVMAATPLVSVATLAEALAMSIKNTGLLLDRFCAEAVAVEVTHRSARRLFGLSGLAPLRAVVQPPRRPQPGRGPGRPRLDRATPEPPPPTPPPAIPRFEQPKIDYSALEAALEIAEQTIRQARRNLATLQS